MYKHSVELLEDKCIGCTNCIKRCPTEAIRVRNGKAKINPDKCIDCGLCIKVCTSHAKRASTQSISMIHDYKFKVAMPAPTVYAQFKKIFDINYILTGIKHLGFDEVFEVSYAAQLVTQATKALLAEGKLKKPVISSACPVIIRLIAMRFPSLIENILPLVAPVELAAKMAKDYFSQRGINRKDIGVFFISPCAAKNSYVFSPVGIQHSEIDGVISLQDIYVDLRQKISSLSKPEALVQCTKHGVDWALTGGESKNVDVENAIAVDGVENVIKILEEIENDQLPDLDFVEGLSCIGGCVGGPLTVTNSFVAKNRMTKVKKVLNEMTPAQKRVLDLKSDYDLSMTAEILPIRSQNLDDNIETALKKLMQMTQIQQQLPSIDCGSCGAPTCQALAEDIVMGDANAEDCVFMLRKKVVELAQSMVDLSAKLPQTFQKASITKERDDEVDG